MAATALGFAPGPDNIFVLTQAAQHGVRAGILVTLGLCTGLVLHTALVVLGVAVVFQTSYLAFTLLKALGAAYLLYLAWQAFRAPATLQLQTSVSTGQLYRRGVIMNITNPKVAIFFLAFLPQFVQPDAGSPTLQIVLLGLVFIVITLIVFSSIALTSGALGAWLQRHDDAQLWLNRIAGTVFVLLALRLLLTEF